VLNAASPPAAESLTVNVLPAPPNELIGTTMCVAKDAVAAPAAVLGERLTVTEIEQPAGGITTVASDIESVVLAPLAGASAWTANPLLELVAPNSAHLEFATPAAFAPLELAPLELLVLLAPLEPLEEEPVSELVAVAPATLLLPLLLPLQPPQAVRVAARLSSNTRREMIV
jgi:hypothetical protein